MAGVAADLLAMLWLVARDVTPSAPAVLFFLLGGAALCLAPLLTLPLAARVRWPAIPDSVIRALAVGLVFVGPPLLAAIRLGLAGLTGTMPWMVPIYLVIGSAAAVAVYRWGERAGFPSSRQVWQGALLAALVLGGLLVAVHRSEGTFSAVRAGRLVLHHTLFVATWAASVATAPVLALRLGRGALQARPRLAALCAAVGVVVGVVLMEADRRALPGEYDFVHLWLAGVGLLALAAGIDVALSLLRLPPRVMSVAGGAGLVIVLSTIGFFLFSGAETSFVFRSRVLDAATGPALLDLHDALREPQMVALPPASGDAISFDFPRFHDERGGAEDMNILLVVVDTLRADQVESPHMPRLKQLAAESAYFTRAYSSSTATHLSMAALMTGRPCGALDWRLFAYRRVGGKLLFADPTTLSPEAAEELEGANHMALPVMPESGTLAERLRAVGRATFATPYGGLMFEPGAGFEKGFDEFPDYSRRTKDPRPTSPLVVKWALEQIDRRPKDKPFFQWVHLIDPHFGRTADKYPEFVKWTDESLGVLFDGLKERGLYDNTIVVVTADHGESFGEHPELTHATSVYEEQIRIPLIMRFPGFKPSRTDVAVSLIDVTATLLAVAGANLQGIEGVNLTPLILRGAYPAHRPVMSELMVWRAGGGMLQRDLRAIIVDNWKLIFERRRKALEVYDLTADPGEKTNLLESEPQKVAQLKAGLDAWLTASDEKHPLPMADR